MIALVRLHRSVPLHIRLGGGSLASTLVGGMRKNHLVLAVQ